MGRELASLGINLASRRCSTFTPIRPNPVIGERAFGQTAEAVIAASLPFMQALQAEKILSCGKHFPGHGDTSVDSHLGLPSQALSLACLRGREIKPFAAAIQAGIPMLMTSHILFPSVDPDAPVTLSHHLRPAFCARSLVLPELQSRTILGWAP